MRHSTSLLATAVLAVVLSGAVRGAQAGVPAPSNSTVPACLATVPGGNIVDLVIVRDLGGNPVNNSLVVIDYSDCPGFVPCPQSVPPTEGYIVDPITKTIRMFSGSAGQAPFYLRAGGGCSGNGIRIYADGVLLGQIHAASADQNGDLTVDGTDIALVHSRIGTADLNGDHNCDGVVNAADESIVAGYVGNNCLNPTPTQRHTWGGVKTIYR
jgi:hypothetical protein